ncbi:alpha/beta fold hydrolase [Nocardia sp. NPDC049707]|uniref:alpha/beta hydrolase family protein n=1 Tax=Nocardia sp. NPDC049707 TaxID=3154735 RepID=UPI00342ACDB2
MVTDQRGRWRSLVVAVVLAVSTMYAVVERAAPPVIATDPAPTAAGTPLRISYGDTPDNVGDLYLPADGSDGPYPVVVLIHGGGWSQNRTMTQFAPMSKSLAEHGVAVWNIEYRRINGSGGWPGTLTDVGDAVNALATVVQQHCGGRLDLRRVHVAGHSAGGQLAAWVAGQHTLVSNVPAAHPMPRILSATLMAAVLDLELAATSGRDAFVRNLLGGLPDEVPDRYQMASPIAHLPVGVHITALHGDKDRVVAPEQSRRYIAAATRAGIPANLRILPGTGHAEFTDIASPAWAAAQQTILDNVVNLH